MRLLIGTSGLGGTHWKGVFYPKELEEDDMLGYYALRLRTLELSSTFYKMPSGEVLHRWSSMTPTDFVFTLRGARDITHGADLEGVEERVKEQLSRAQLLGHKLGPVLYTFPSKLKKDVGLLERFLGTLPAGTRAAFDLKSRSWHGDDEVLALLEKHGAALCVSDHEDPKRTTPLLSTARFGYLRLRSASYSDEQLESWVERILAQDWDDAYVFFTHDREGIAPKLALRMLEHAEAMMPIGRSAARSEIPAAPQLKPLVKIAPAAASEGSRARRKKPVARSRSRTRKTRRARGWRGGAPR